MTNVRGRIPQIDVLFRLRTLHRPGFLAKVFKTVADHGGLVGDIRTSFVGKANSIRDVTISVHDAEHQHRIRDALNELEGLDVLHTYDVVFDLHKGGKIRVRRSRDIESLHDLRYYYTPGVARVCQAIAEDEERARDLTCIGNTIAIVTNGTRVLGLGDIGPLAAMPVMEGKAMIYDQFVGLGAMPLLLDTKDKDEFIRTVETFAPTFAGIHLEDIRMPDCFDIEDTLVERLGKPVMHDDQHGTATVCLAAVLSALRIQGKEGHRKLNVAQIGLGAAGFGIAKLLREYGFDVIGVDPNPDSQARFKSKLNGTIMELSEAMKSADLVVATTGKVGLIQPAMIRKGQIIFALSNPIAEIDPDDAVAAGAAFAADGAHVNNALAYPGLFKGALKANALAISPAMKIAAAEEISKSAEDGELLPSMFAQGLHERVTTAVANAAIKSKA